MLLASYVSCWITALLEFHTSHFQFAVLWVTSHILSSALSIGWSPTALEFCASPSTQWHCLLQWNLTRQTLIDSAEPCSAWLFQNPFSTSWRLRVLYTDGTWHFVVTVADGGPFLLTSALVWWEGFINLFLTSSVVARDSERKGGIISSDETDNAK